jgi:hypothetical protein
VIRSSRRLLQIVEGLVEPAHQLRVSRVNEADKLGGGSGGDECRGGQIR